MSATTAGQAGDRLPVEVAVASSDARCQLTLYVPASLFWFRGHFPSFPILPGVVQLDWAITYGRLYFALGMATVAAMQMKFRRPVRPETRLTLALAHQAERHRLTFEYADAEGAYSSGQLSFATP